MGSSLNYKRALLSFAILVLVMGCEDAKIENFIRENASIINNINVDSDDYSDLMPIGDAIGDSRIVMLGEQDHGDAPAFLAKTRLVKFLHEKKGFDVLAFESDFFALTDGWDKVVKTRENISGFIKRNIFLIWTYCDACSYLFYQYIPDSYASQNPIELAGFDNQLILGHSKSQLARLLDSVLTADNLPVIKNPRYQTFIKEGLESLMTQYQTRNGSQSFYANNEAVLSEMKTQLSAKPGNQESYWVLIIENLIQFNKELATKNGIESNNARDKQMALNLQWLLNNKFRNKKIIVWAHNVHIMKNVENFSDAKYRSTRMGSYFLKLSGLSNQTYVLGFTSSKGVAGRIGLPQYKVSNGESKSIDGVLLDLNYKFAFLDFNKFNSKYPDYGLPFLMKGYSHAYSKEKWNLAFNGIFYIRDMYPCKVDSSLINK
jgi:erythromycin esterase